MERRPPHPGATVTTQRGCCSGSSQRANQATSALLWTFYLSVFCWSHAALGRLARTSVLGEPGAMCPMLC